MPEHNATVVGRPVWIDLASSDAAASRAFYATLFGWTVEVNPDPQYGGYAVARLQGRDVAGIGPSQAPGTPTAWSLYIGTDDADALAERVQSAGGTVVAAPFSVGDQGRMAVFQDPTGAFVSAWEAEAMPGFAVGGPNAFCWAELSARDMARAIAFYRAVVGWEAREWPMPDGQPYVLFGFGGDEFVGGMEMSPIIPADVPSYWLVYFAVADLDATYRAALDAGASEMVSPADMPGGRFAIVRDPQGAIFGLQMLTVG